MFIDYKKSRILVTGGAGFMGSHFLRYLLTKTPFQGKVVNYDLLTYAGDLANVEEISQDERYSFVHGDVADRHLMHTVIKNEKISLIIHFAGESHVDRSIEKAEPFIKTNILGTESILDCLRHDPHIHFHFISTDEVYGDLPLEGCFTESSPYKPSSPYAASKAAAELFIFGAARTYGLSITISRGSNNYGPAQYPEKLIPVVITKALNYEPIPIFGNGENIRDWIYVDDHTRGVLKILEKGSKSNAYNLGAGNELKNIDLVHKILDILSKLSGVPKERYSSLIRFLSDRLGHDFRYALDMQKMRSQIGYQTETTLDDGLFKTVKWYYDRR